MLHLPKVIRGPLNMLPDVMPMSRPMEQRPQDQHVQSSL
jgi:hypothetical protein